jgi:tricorn protease
MNIVRKSSFAVVCSFLSVTVAGAGSPLGYYRHPTLHQDTLVFVAEGDLWKVRAQGGVATRLTSHAGEESLPALSPDGQTLAFTAHYEGPTEVYTMPISGGRPLRHTFGAGDVSFVGWTPQGKIVYSTDRYSTLPNHQLVTIEPAGKDQAGHETLVPLAQAAEGCHDETGKTLFFTRLPFQGSHTKRYRGGTAPSLWTFSKGDADARPLTRDYTGASKNPMWWRGRVFFVSDRDETMNLWSMNPDGRDLKQHTRHTAWDVATPSLWGGRIAYQLGADIHIYDVDRDEDRLVPITLESDLDQTRERWVEKPMEYLTSAHLAPDGRRVALTARGRVFVAPHRQGRLVEATRKEGVRYRDARFMPDGKSLLVLSDESGEVEFWKAPADGIGDAEQLTSGGEVLRWEGAPSPDGKWLAHRDKNQRLLLFDVAAKKDRLIEESKIGDFSALRWSPDSKWLAYVVPAENMLLQIKLYGVVDATITPLTTDRFDSYSPAWSPDGKWIYFLSDRNLKAIASEPSETYQPEPFLDKKTKIYQIPLVKELRSPFAPRDELRSKEMDEDDDTDEPGSAPVLKIERAAIRERLLEVPIGAVKIERAGIRERLLEVPIAPGNYSELNVTSSTLFWLSTPAGEKLSSLCGAEINHEDVVVKTIVDGIKSYELSRDGKKILVHKDQTLSIIDAYAAPAEVAKKEVDLSKWTLSVQPREEWRQMFVEAWRLERDYFYDKAMHGVDWKGVLKKYLPLVDRVQSRAELADLTAQMVSELSALHMFIRGGDVRTGRDQVDPAFLGARLVRDEANGGYRVVHRYRFDPDEPERAGPLARPNVDVEEGDVIEMINGRPTLSTPDVGTLLRGKGGQQVRLRIKPAAKEKPRRDVIVTPIEADADADLRYHEWEYTRRLKVDELSNGTVGYVHLRAMEVANFTEWAKGFYPVFHRPGLIIDVRHNEGGNIDSWIIGRLLRKAWSYETQRVGQPPTWNMPFAFRGHLVVLCDENTGSDGEIFAEGIKRLGLGKVIGTRTWGGSIGLSFSNVLVDNGIATAAEFGLYGPEGKWLIEGHGVEPDIMVDNLPHATFKGEDAQLRTAIAHLQRLIEEKPVRMPARPAHPNKAWKGKPASK